jgi:hypothetical protein
MLSLQVSQKNVSRISAHGKGVAIDKDNQNCPHLVNLNEDPLMTECLVYFLPPGQTLGTASFFLSFFFLEHHELLYQVVRQMTECLLYLHYTYNILYIICNILCICTYIYIHIYVNIYEYIYNILYIIYVIYYVSVHINIYIYM